MRLNDKFKAMNNEKAINKVTAIKNLKIGIILNPLQKQ